ncbi:MAG: hypothetical protein AABY15_07105 [Nanoarchaeota archaeon]
MEKSIEDRLSELEKISLQDIEDKLAQHQTETNASAILALNEIHWILKCEDSDENIVKKVREILEIFNSKTFEGLRLYIEKHQKEQYTNDPERFKEQLKHMKELSEKFRAEDAKIEADEENSK